MSKYLESMRTIMDTLDIMEQTPLRKYYAVMPASPGVSAGTYLIHDVDRKPRGLYTVYLKHGHFTFRPENHKKSEFTPTPAPKIEFKNNQGMPVTIDSVWRDMQGEFVEEEKKESLGVENNFGIEPAEKHTKYDPPSTKYKKGVSARQGMVGSYDYGDSPKLIEKDIEVYGRKRKI